jgi:peroxiredoxin
MKKIYAALVLSFLFTGSLYAQSATQKDTDPKTDTVRLMPDDNTVYLDEHDAKITMEQFFKAVSSGEYSYDPKIENKKIISIHLLKKGALTGVPAKDFTATDINGNNYSLKQLKGKIIVLNFWFASCKPCIEEMPALNVLAEKYKADSNIVFLAATFETTENVKTFLSKKAFKFHILPNQVNMVSLYQVNAYPTTLVIDAQQQVVYNGISSAEGSIARIDSIISSLSVQKQ